MINGGTVKYCSTLGYWFDSPRKQIKLGGENRKYKELADAHTSRAQVQSHHLAKQHTHTSVVKVNTYSTLAYSSWWQFDKYLLHMTYPC